MYAPRSRWTISFLAIAAIQSNIVLALEITVFSMVQASIVEGTVEGEILTNVIPTSLSLLIFAVLYQLALVYDALQEENTMQILGLVVLNLTLFVYGVIQLLTFRNLANNATLNDLPNLELFTQANWFTIIITTTLGIGTVALAVVAWKLYDEFAWTIYKRISANLKMKRRYLNYQVFIAILKIGAFYYVGFLIQFIVIIRDRTNTENIITVVILPITLILLIIAVHFIRHEHLFGALTILALFTAELVYFIFLFTTLYTSQYSEPYVVVRPQLTAFSVITFLLMVALIIGTCQCIFNFKKGLKPYLCKPRTVPTHEMSSLGTRSSATTAHDRNRKLEARTFVRSRPQNYHPVQSDE